MKYSCSFGSKSLRVILNETLSCNVFCELIWEQHSFSAVSCWQWALMHSPLLHCLHTQLDCSALTGASAATAAAASALEWQRASRRSTRPPRRPPDTRPLTWPSSEDRSHGASWGQVSNIVAAFFLSACRNECNKVDILWQQQCTCKQTKTRTEQRARFVCGCSMFQHWNTVHGMDKHKTHLVEPGYHTETQNDKGKSVSKHLAL